MRETKFRAWDKTSKRMITGLYLDFQGRIGMWNYEETEIEFGEYPNLLLMQYTGLKDKNGKEIFEGDICLTRGFIVENGRQKRPEERFVIKPTIESWHIVFCLSSVKNLEVIGNICENPELLKKEV